MKKTFAFILALIALILCFAGCDNDNTPDRSKNLCGHTSSIQKADADVFDSGVYYAGYYLPDSLVENSLNFDKLANSRLDRAIIYKFDTYDLI